MSAELINQVIFEILEWIFHVISKSCSVCCNIKYLNITRNIFQKLAEELLSPDLCVDYDLGSTQSGKSFPQSTKLSTSRPVIAGLQQFWVTYHSAF